MKSEPYRGPILLANLHHLVESNSLLLLVIYHYRGYYTLNISANDREFIRSYAGKEIKTI